jgi:hypothetical protein
MANRAELIEDLDLSDLTPPRGAKVEPAPFKKVDRRHRTGRSEQLNLKVRAEARELFYRLTDAQGWVQGYAFERAVQALQKELNEETRPGKACERIDIVS